MAIPASEIHGSGPVVVGLDFSLTATGVAILAPSFKYEPIGWVETLKSKPQGETYASRGARLAGILKRVDQLTQGATLVVVEGPAYSSSSGHMFDRAGLWWGAVSALYASRVPVGVVPPTTLKKWATGGGRAEKTAVALAITKLWAGAGQRATDFDIKNDNEADALCLATMGAQWLGEDVPQLARHAECVSRSQWPPRGAI